MALGFEWKERCNGLHHSSSLRLAVISGPLLLSFAMHKSSNLVGPPQALPLKGEATNFRADPHAWIQASLISLLTAGDEFCLRDLEGGQADSQDVHHETLTPFHHARWPIRTFSLTLTSHFNMR